MIRQFMFFIFLGVITAPTAQAAVLGKCGFLNEPSFIVASRSFYNGKVTLEHVDSDGEPACCSSRVLIKVMSGNSSYCYALGSSGLPSDVPLGFSDVRFSQVHAYYNPADGLLIEIPYNIYDLDGDGSGGGPRTSYVRINLSGSSPYVSLK